MTIEGVVEIPLPPKIVIAALVAVIHLGAGEIYQDNAVPTEPWITGTSPVMTV